MGQPHPTGRAALRMLEAEGFAYDRYIDIFDGGPTVTAPTDRIRTVREVDDRDGCARSATAARAKMLVAAGRLKDFRACCASVKRLAEEGHLHRSGSGRAARGGSRRRGGDGRRADGLDRDQLRRDRRAQPQLCGAQPRQPRFDAQRRRRYRSHAPRRLQGIDKMRANLGARARPGNSPAAPAPASSVARRAWRRRSSRPIRCSPRMRCRHRRCGRPTRRPSLLLPIRRTASVTSPSPTSGPCRTAATNGPRRWRNFGWLSRARRFAVHGPVPPAFGDEGAANHMRLAPRTASRASRYSSMACRAGRFRRASISKRRRRSRGCTGSIRTASIFARAVGGSDRRRRVPQRRRRGRQ